MAHYSFSTENADYVFQSAFHFWPRLRPELFTGIDALVTECNPNIASFEEIPPVLAGAFVGSKNYDFLTSTWFSKYAEYIATLRDNNTPLFSVDVRCTDPDRQFHEATSLEFLCSILYGVSTRQLPQWAVSYISKVEQKYQYPERAARSAIAAEKIERGIIPRLKTTKKPKIGLVYGLIHADIITYLMNADSRNTTITHHQQIDWRGLNKDDLDHALRFSYSHSNKHWKISKEHLSIFNSKPSKRSS
ncbi:hypothetical protein J4219_02960 [Candidatus Woesearchaeota archaeon]|nr:hypothetical protein [Candidatus Woesearchaeota archaeon]